MNIELKDLLALGHEYTQQYAELKEIVRSLIIAYDSNDMTAVEGLLNQAQELVK